MMKNENEIFKRLEELSSTLKETKSFDVRVQIRKEIRLLEIVGRDLDWTYNGEFVYI